MNTLTSQHILWHHLALYSLQANGLDTTAISNYVIISPVQVDRTKPHSYQYTTKSGVSESSSSSCYEGVSVKCVSLAVVKMCTFCVGVYINTGAGCRNTASRLW